MKMPLEFQPQLEERCLGQITRTQIKPEIIDRRGYCRECNYNLIENQNCVVYRDPKNRVVVRVFEVVEN